MNYQFHYNTMMNRARNRSAPEGYVEIHHVLPRCLGGSDEPENLVILTAREHYVAHQLLVKMNPGNYGLSYAAMLMTRIGKSQGRVSNRYYEWLKRRFSKLQSELMKSWLKENVNPSERESVKQKRREAWLGDKNPSFKKPNWKAIRAAADATRGKPQSETHNKKIALSIKKWHAENPDKHPMKNPETIAKAVESRRLTWLKKKGLL